MKEADESKKSKGGARKRAGRKPTGESIPTVIMRVPEELQNEVKKMITRYRNSWSCKNKKEKMKLKKGEKVLIALSYWNEEKSNYESIYLLRKTTKLRESYFETEGEWKFFRVGEQKGCLFENLCSEYKSITKDYGKPDSLMAEKYIPKWHKKYKFTDLSI